MMERPDRIEIKNLQSKPAKGGISISAVRVSPSAETEAYPSTHLIRLRETNPSVKSKNQISPVGEIKTNYDKGDTIKLLVGCFGSMDLYWAETILQLKIFQAPVLSLW